MPVGQPEATAQSAPQRASLPDPLPMVCAVVVNYCCARETLRCVEGLCGSLYERLAIVVVDNASPDGSAAVLRARFAGSRRRAVGSGQWAVGSEQLKIRSGKLEVGSRKSKGGSGNPEDDLARAARANYPFGPRPEVAPAGQLVVQACAQAETLIELLSCAENRGFAAGANAGIRWAIETGAEFVWLLTPDVIVEPQTLPSLVRAMAQDARLGICGPVICAGGQFITGCRMWPWLGYYARLRTGKPASAGCSAPLLPTDYVDGGCMLVRKDLLSQVGLLCEGFFLYYEDVEFSLRARRAGWRVAVVSSARAQTRPPRVERNGRAYFLVRNSLWLARREGRFLLPTIARHVVQCAWHACRHIWCATRSPSVSGRSTARPNHQQAARTLRATWQGLRAGLRRR